jgi:hypothetical protein
LDNHVGHGIFHKIIIIIIITITIRDGDTLLGTKLEAHDFLRTRFVDCLLKKCKL